MFFKKGILSTGLSFAILLPSASLSHGHALSDHTVFFHSSAIVAEDEKTEFSPDIKEKAKDLKSKFKKGEITEDHYHEEMKKIKPKKCSHKRGSKLSAEDKAKLKALKAQLENGEITTQEFKKQFKGLQNKE
ncbi:hypothetical protein EDC18_10464 [Natranaerovirga pectinivora]|uniref:SHOCT domain-containing protein n=1 Tax=Natranaerovirga pectinivora TaxID=682400 RepID=A0A4R3MLD2_9FIRM|nr:SHOCT domain-containing protein [Natranaerovirga pectinivora]TCT14914.1 hypothetical protein EDC18_10464 [Natranaerovirga pectinivora]